jgi:hypothetical protein
LPKLSSEKFQEYLVSLGEVDNMKANNPLDFFDLIRDKKISSLLAWLARYPGWTFHFTPTSASWLKAVENFFSKMTRQHIRRGVFHSIADLQAAINAYLAQHKDSPKPSVWSQSAKAILAKLDRLPVTSV